MKYWIFQNNQVTGPFEPTDMSDNPAFTAESLVCPEGRRGTSMGDWQRAGMVPDLSVALVRAAQAHSVRNPVATLAGLPPEPTLKDLAVLGSLQEKMSMLEDVVLQLQEGLRDKDAELSALHEELAGKDRESAEMKRESSQIRAEADALKEKTEAQRREADKLKAETDEFKLKISELEERIGAVNRLSDTIDKAVEAEKHVEHDVEAQGATLAELTKEMEALRTQLQERLSAAAAVPPPPAAPGAWPAPARGEPMPSLAPPAPGSADDAFPSIAPPPADAPFPSMAPPPSMDAPLPSMAPPPSVDAPLPSMAPPPSMDAPLPSMAPPPSANAPFEAAPLPAFGAPAFGAPDAAAAPIPMPGFDPLGPASAPAAAPAPVAEGPAPVVDVSSSPEPAAKPRSKKPLLFGILGGLLALGAFAVYSGRLDSLMGKKAAMPAAPVDTAPLPPPAPVEPVPPPPDPRETAIQAAKEWPLADGRTLGSALETASPPAGNLSPWMAETLPNNRAMVNYFAHGSPGTPTVAYEFEVDLANRGVTGRNAAAKAALAGKAVRPPAPPKPKKVVVKVKAKPAPPKAKPRDSLDSILGSGYDEKPASPLAAPSRKAASDDAPSLDGDAPSLDDDAPSLSVKPAKAPTAKRAAKAAAKPQRKLSPAEGKAADEALLDDLLKE